METKHPADIFREAARLIFNRLNSVKYTDDFSEIESKGLCHYVGRTFGDLTPEEILASDKDHRSVIYHLIEGSTRQDHQVHIWVTDWLDDNCRDYRDQRYAAELARNSYGDEGRKTYLEFLKLQLEYRRQWALWIADEIESGRIFVGGRSWAR